MEETTNNLVERFYQEFWIFLVLLILISLLTISLIIVVFIQFKKLPCWSKIGTPIISIFLLGLSFVLGIYFSRYYNDYVYLKNNTPIQIEGTVIEYSIAASNDDLTVTKSWPIILTDGTNERISLNIVKAEKRVKINEKYIFLYLPNTKIAEIVEQVS